MKKLLLIAGILLSLSLAAREAVLYSSSVDRPPEADWVIYKPNVYMTMSQAPWPNGESGLTVKFSYIGNAEPEGTSWWPSGKLYLARNPSLPTDWTSAKTLTIEAFVERSARIGVKVQSIGADNKPISQTVSFQSPLVGRNTFRISIAELTTINLANIEFIDIFTSNPKTDYSIYVGDIKLDIADPEEEAAMRTRRTAELRKALDWRKALLGKDIPCASGELVGFEKNLPDTPTAEQLAEFERLTAEQFPVMNRTFFRKSAKEGFAVLWCDAAEKVLRDKYAFLCPPSKEAFLDAAKGEGECAQLVGFAAKQIGEAKAALVAPPKSAEGNAIPLESLKLSPMGYVLTREDVHSYRADYYGYWPDPILEYLDTPIPVERNTYQAWWLDVNVPVNQEPGLYRGQVKVTWDNGGETTLPYTVRVRDFALEEGVPYFSPVAFTALGNYPADAAGRKEYWRDIARLLIRHRLQPDYLYAGPDRAGIVEDARFFIENGSKHFNIGYINTEVDDALAATIKKAYDEVKAAGLLEYAYFYCYDEKPAELFEMISRSLRRVREIAPEVPIYTTMYDSTFGQASNTIGFVDGWIPLTKVYGDNQKGIEEARARGEKIGWYVCCTPLAPYANFLLEMPSTANRLLMGFMNKKFKTDFFLYYNATVWRIYEKNQTGSYVIVGVPDPISGGPLIGGDWYGESFQNFAGDGRLTYPAMDGPIPTQRIKMIRDGIEDWMYLDMLEKAVDNSSDMSAEWYSTAIKEVDVEDELVTSLIEWTTDPALVKDKKARIADLLEEYYKTK